MDTDSPGPRNGLRPRSTHLVVSAVIAATAVVAGILILALVPDHRRPGVLTAVSVDEFLTARSADPSASAVPLISVPATSAPATRQPSTVTPAATPAPTTVPPSPAPRVTETSPPDDRPRVTILNNSRKGGLAESAKPVVERAGFSVADVGNYRAKPGAPPGSFNLAKTTVFYEKGQEAYVADLVDALSPKDSEGIESKLNDGEKVSPNGTLVLVLTAHFSPT